jgi:hypothetical protein
MRVRCGSFDRVRDLKAAQDLLCFLSFRTRKLLKLNEKENGGETEIRTLGGLQTHDGFQDRCLKPLSHLSVSRL